MDVALRPARGIEAWRDGPHVVLHREADLPPYCIKTGAETGFSSQITLDWTYPIDWSRRRRSLAVPLEIETYNRLVLWIWRVEVATGLFLSVALLVFVLRLGASPNVYAIFGWGSIFALIAFLIAHDRRNRILRVVRFHGDYLWLAGCEEPFLARLPDEPDHFV
jgi:hypothetical protein